VVVIARCVTIFEEFSVESRINSHHVSVVVPTMRVALMLVLVSWVKYIGMHGVLCACANATSVMMVV
jgi:hypothetical protein